MKGKLSMIVVLVGLLSLFVNDAHAEAKRHVIRNPIWPNDFWWSYAGIVYGMWCFQIREPSDPHTWNDNYFCSNGHKKHPGLRWSYAGPIAGMRCTQIVEPSDPHTWNDNYLCVPRNSPLHFHWSYAGPIRGKACIQWREPSDPNTWNDNFLCA